MESGKATPFQGRARIAALLERIERELALATERLAQVANAS
jgi:hypothetical protein